MGRFGRDELLRAFEDYKRARDVASRTGDWNVWADLFAPDAHYIEHAYGELSGRDAIRDWIVKVMAPFPTMTFPATWVVVDEENGAIVWEVRNEFPAPVQPSGEPYWFANWSRLVYAGDGLWQSEEDVYNPSRDAGRVFKAWLAAGGRTRSREQVQIKHK